MEQTIVGTFDAPLEANEALHVLERSGFVAERIPRLDKARGPPRKQAFLLRVGHAILRRCQVFMDADMYLSPFASALAQKRFVVKVYSSDDLEARAARAILKAAGAKDIDTLADEWVER